MAHLKRAWKLHPPSPCIVLWMSNLSYILFWWTGDLVSKTFLWVLCAASLLSWTQESGHWNLQLVARGSDAQEINWACSWCLKSMRGSESWCQNIICWARCRFLASDASAAYLETRFSEPVNQWCSILAVHYRITWKALKKIQLPMGLPWWLMVKNLPACAEDTALIPGLGVTCHGAIKPVCHNHWACALAPGSCNFGPHALPLLNYMF